MKNSPTRLTISVPGQWGVKVCYSVSRQSTNRLYYPHSRMISSENELFVPMRCRRLISSGPVTFNQSFVQTTGRLPYGVLTFNHLLLIEVSPQWINTLFILVAINCFFPKRKSSFLYIDLYCLLLMTRRYLMGETDWVQTSINPSLALERKERQLDWG